MSAAPEPTGKPALIDKRGGLIVVDKPPTWLVHNSAYAGPAEDTLTAWVRREIAEGAVPLHRIDRATSGIVAFATDRKAAAELGPVYASDATRKTYVAMCRGVLQSAVRVEHAMRNEGGTFQDATSDFWPMATNSETRSSLIAASPITGRTHQLRRHAKHLSHPLVGDVKYGKGEVNRAFREQFGLRRLALHHTHLTLGGVTYFCPPGGALGATIAACYGMAIDASTLARVAGNCIAPPK